MKKQIVVVKIGSSALSDENGNLKLDTMLELAKGVSELSKTQNVILVSSGAVAAGKNFIEKYKASI